MQIDDYTALPIGTKIETGEVKICIYCGRRGLTEKKDGKLVFLHRMIKDPDAMEVRWEECPSSS